ncbi:hypothetical protein E1281_34625 [Actinomadura sp. KC345]|uniref:DUF6192 family protein n=1 Tax=Actinomadura sp. KC345 TaxID=2530371 RepID=UPI001049EF7A|nr:DUF6192 family protein [Actinomadura sp. KC345]TDC44020.1 hypothetical protein E1281_34625 [Actinomadura sp. KC345]
MAEGVQQRCPGCGQSLPGWLRHEWTEDAAKRVVGQKVNHPRTSAEKATAIHDLAADEQVAAAADTDLLRRPDVAFKAMGDGAARHMVNRAPRSSGPARLSSGTASRPGPRWSGCSRAGSSWT